jgi:hypothetical protein
VVPSGALTTQPAAVTSSAQMLFLADGFTTTLNSSQIVTAYTPALLLYAATDSSNNIHVYELDLALGTQPTATQIGSLSLPLQAGAAIDTVICDSNYALTDFLQPDTVFVVLHVAGPAGCGTTGDQWMVVHAGDAESTSPVSVPIATTQFTPLYAPTGSLTGLVLRDPNTQNVFLYGDDSFSQPTAAIPNGGVSAMTIIFDNKVNGKESFIGTELFLSATINSVDYLYQLPYNATTAMQVYTATGTLTTGVADDTNLYFSDVQVTTSTTQGIWQVPLAGGAATLLYTYAVPATGVPYELVGSNNSVLVLVTNSTNGSTGATTGSLATLPVGVASVAVAPLGSALNGLTSAFVLPTTPGTRSSDLVFADAVNTGPSASYMYSSLLLTPGNVIKQAALPNSYFLTDSNGAVAGAVLQLTGINPAVAGMGGGPVNALELSTLTLTPLKSSANATYTLPNGFDPLLAGLSNAIGAGQASPHSPTTGNTLGLAYDLSKSLIAPISILNSNVALF